MSGYDEITVATGDGVTTITLNRPDRLNAWTDIMAQELCAAVTEAGNDRATRCIVITGAGRGFCAGADMERLSAASDAGSEPPQEPSGHSVAGFPAAPGPEVERLYPGRFGYFYACPKPIIAAINGPCAGIGLVMALFADLRYAAEDAVMTTSFAARGLVAEHGIAWILPRMVGEAQALDLLMTARKFRGAEAAAMGLVNEALPGDGLMDRVGEMSRRLAHEVSPRSVAVMKRQVRAAREQSFADSLAMADAEMQKSFSAHDFQEGVRSFVQKRPPSFQGI
ncbi:MAG: enoyl-CoA hydratase [Pseudomonadota bacterium]